MNASFTLSNDTEFKTIEHYLRKLYNTADGQPCQYLLSSSFQKWLHDVRTCLRQAKDSTNMSTYDIIETYLPNYHLVFFNNEVSITFIKPVVPMKPNSNDNTKTTKRVEKVDVADNASSDLMNRPMQKQAHSIKKQKIRHW